MDLCCWSQTSALCGAVCVLPKVLDDNLLVSRQAEKDSPESLRSAMRSSISVLQRGDYLGISGPETHIKVR